MRRLLAVSIDLVLPAAFVVCWSSGFVGAAMATGAGAPAATTLLWRYVVTGGLLLVVAAARHRRPSAGFLLREVVIGLPVQALYLGGVFAGVGRGVPAGTSALIASLQPLLVAVVLSRLDRSRVGIGRALGLAAGLLGVCLAVGGDAGLGGGVMGVALVAGGTLALTVGTILGERWPRSSDTDIVDSLTVQALVTLCFFAAIAILQGTTTPPASTGFWGAVALLVGVAFAGGYGCYLWLVEHRGAVTASALLLLTPGVSAAWAAATLGEPITPLEAVGFAVALAGVVPAARRARPDRARPVRPGARCEAAHARCSRTSPPAAAPPRR